MQIQKMTCPTDIEKCFEAFLELRPHMTDKGIFVQKVLSQQKEGYEINSISNEAEVEACIGYRTLTTLAWGKILYIDDLITREKYRGKGLGSLLLKHAFEQAKILKCDQIHLDTGYTRHAAHKLYLQHGFELTCHHLALKLS